MSATCNRCGRDLQPGRAELCDLCRVPRSRPKRLRRRQLARAERYLRQAIAPPDLIGSVERQLAGRLEDGQR